MSIEIRGMAPLIQVFDMPKSVSFYRDLLGFEVVSSSPVRRQDDFDWCLLRRDGIEVMLNTAYEADDRPDAPDRARVLAHRDTTLFFGSPDVDAVWRHLEENGVSVGAPIIAPYGMKQLSLIDPDGYGICFQWPVE